MSLASERGSAPGALSGLPLDDLVAAEMATVPPLRPEQVASIRAAVNSLDVTVALPDRKAS